MKIINLIGILIFFALSAKGQDSAIIYFQKAMISESLEDEITYYNKTLEIDSSYFEVYLLRGIAYYNSKEYLKAILDFKSLQKYDSLNAKAYYYSALSNWQLGNYSDAMKYINKSIEIDKYYADAYGTRGIWKNMLESNIPAKSGDRDLRKAKRLKK